MEFTTDPNGRPMQGPTTGRPGNAFNGQVYFDTTIGQAVVWDGSQWCAGSFAGGAQSDRISAALAVPGSTFYNDDTGVLQVNDGANWLDTFEEDHEESSSSST